jgi:hypothetical protein
LFRKAEAGLDFSVFWSRIQLSFSGDSEMTDRFRAEIQQDPTGKKTVIVEARGPLAITLTLIFIAVDRSSIPASNTPKPLPSETNSKLDLRLP